MLHINIEFLKKQSNLLHHKKCVFIVGAGISVASGIPDFRSPNGIFATLRKQLKINGKELFTYDFGIKEETRKIYLKYISTLKRLCDGAEPNVMHNFLTNFPKSRIYTQNIDSLEEKAGMVFSKTDSTKGVYLHGNLSTLACQYCGFKKNFEESEIKDFENCVDVLCKQCLERREHCEKNGIRRKPMGVMHPGIIHYHQVHPESAFISKMCEKDLDCDLLIVIGTSLCVDGVKKLVKTFARGPNVKGKRILINLTKPNKEWDSYFDYFFEGDCVDFINTVQNFNLKPKSVKSALEFGSEADLRVKFTGPQVIDNIKESYNGAIDKKKTILEYKETAIHDNETLVKSTETVINDNETTLDYKEIDVHVRRLSITKEIDNKNCSFEEKLKNLTKSFSDEETIDLPVLDDALKSSAQTEIDTSFCSNLQSEIEQIVKQSVKK